MADNLPVVNMEVSSGTFRIKTAEAIYQITVTPDSSLTRVVEKVVVKEAPPTKAPEGSSEDDPFYKDLTQDMYSEIGRLARQLSLSIKEIPGQSFKGLDIKSAGIELEDAKGQLEDIVQMTEKATMDIMDLAENIQEELKEVNTRLLSIKQLDFMSEGGADLDWDAEPGDGFGDDPKAGTPDSSGLFDEIIEKVSGLRAAVAGLPRLETVPKAPATEPASKPTTEYRYDLDVVFQTLYELCTNEAVKDHIKAMRADRTTSFDGETVKKALAQMAETVTVEDNFFNFSITNILKSLFQACTNDKYKQVLKKMNQSAGSIFLDNVLPIEGEVRQETPRAESAPSVSDVPSGPGLPEGRIEELLSLIDANLRLLEEKKALAAKAPGTPAAEDGFTRVKSEDRQEIVGSVEGASGQLQNVMSQITRILETLAFQDLSGQRILKIVRLISDVQVQLLSILVSFGAKIKQKKEEPEVVTQEGAHKMAQNEVDKMLEKVGGSSLEGPEAEGRLNQDAVDGLLADLGF